jgi:hypothetical protein
MRNAAPVALAALTLALFASPIRAQTFTRVLDPAIVAAPDSCSAASWVDVDGDGDLDLFVGTWSASSPNLLFLNNGLGVFTRAAIPALDASPTECFGSSWADADQDGLPDLFVSQLFNGGGALFRAQPGPSFTPVAGPPSGSAIKGNASWADMDLDGDVDLVLACLNGTGGVVTPNRLFENRGGLTFAERDSGVLVTTLDTHHTAAWADDDGDGDPDLFFATGGVGSTKRDRLYQNMRVESGVAWFRPITTGVLATDLRDSQQWSWADYDNDGDLDAYVLNYTTLPNMLYRNDGGGAFTRITTAGPIVTDAGAAHGCAWGDFDNDGDLDVYVARDATQQNRYYRNNGNGTFTSVTAGDFVTRLSSNWNAVAGDMDRDGDLDLFVPIRSPASAGLLYRNDLAAGSHWLELRLAGVVSNRSALGARVRVKARIGGVDRWQLREVATGTSYGGQSMLDPHFGLGDAAIADSVEIRWPSGIRQVLTGVPANQVRDVLEDVSTAVTASVVVARATAGRIEVVWEVAADPGTPVEIERSRLDGEWQPVEVSAVDGTRRVRWEEPAPRGATHLSYRLRLDDRGTHVAVGEVTVTVAPTTSFSLSLADGQTFVARVSLPAPAEVAFDVVDIAGRRARETLRRSLPTGEHSIALDPGDALPAGLYWVRARADGEVRMVRAVRLR